MEITEMRDAWRSPKYTKDAQDQMENVEKYTVNMPSVTCIFSTGSSSSFRLSLSFSSLSESVVVFDRTLIK
jgi:hypothetical protein